MKPHRHDVRNLDLAKMVNEDFMDRNALTHMATSLMMLLLAMVGTGIAQEPVADKPADPKADMESVDLSVKMSEGAVEFSADKNWKRKKIDSKFISHEFAIAPVKGDEIPGRLTVSSAQGSVEANIERWKKQFSQPDGSDTEDHFKMEEVTIADQKVHMVDITGTFGEKRGGPFGPTTERPGYRMLAAIVNVKDTGQYFLKLYGPAKTITKQEAAFHKFVKSLKVNQ